MEETKGFEKQKRFPVKSIPKDKREQKRAPSKGKVTGPRTQKKKGAEGSFLKGVLKNS